MRKAKMGENQTRTDRLEVSDEDILSISDRWII